MIMKPQEKKKLVYNIKHKILYLAYSLREMDINEQS